VGINGKGWHYWGKSKETWAFNPLLERNEGGIGGGLWSYGIFEEQIWPSNRVVQVVEDRFQDNGHLWEE
jgi:hypothetical protein